MSANTSLSGIALLHPVGSGLGQRLIRMLTRSAVVTQVQMLAPKFFQIRLEGNALKHVTWRPGQAMQIVFGAATARAYTPIGWDTEQGVLDILVYAHGSAPGSNWAEAAKPGDKCQVVGPRRSLDLTDLPRPAILLGDETSIALAVSLRHTTRQLQDVELIFEVNSVVDVTQALRALGLPHSKVIQRTAGDAHMDNIGTHLTVLLAQRQFSQVISTGKATSIQHIGRFLKRRGFASSGLTNRAYWAPCKKGMD